MVCGKIAAGKTTLCRALAETAGTIVIAQDQWMSTLYPEMRTVADYFRLAPRLRNAAGPHVMDLLKARLSIVLDWPANTIETRSWMRNLFEAAGVRHRLHVLEVQDEVCLARLRERNLEGKHPYRVSDDEFAELTSYFELPHDSEGFATVVRP